MAVCSTKNWQPKLKAWMVNDEIINEHNAKNFSWWLGHNAFSDLTWEQFKATHISEIFVNRNPVNSHRVFIKQPGYKQADSS